MSNAIVTLSSPSVLRQSNVDSPAKDKSAGKNVRWWDDPVIQNRSLPDCWGKRTKLEDKVHTQTQRLDKLTERLSKVDNVEKDQQLRLKPDGRIVSVESRNFVKQMLRLGKGERDREANALKKEYGGATTLAGLKALEKSWKTELETTNQELAAVLNECEAEAAAKREDIARNAAARESGEVPISYKQRMVEARDIWRCMESTGAHNSYVERGDAGHERASTQPKVNGLPSPFFIKQALINPKTSKPYDSNKQWAQD